MALKVQDGRPKSSLVKLLRKFYKKKSDAQVGRVSTFQILQTICKGPLNFKLSMKRSLKFLNSEYVVLFLDPKLLNKSATRFILR
jgi:hypothetical protein